MTKINKKSQSISVNNKKKSGGIYKFKSFYRRDDYLLSEIPFRSCLIYSNLCKLDLRNLCTGEPVYNQLWGLVRSSPKRFSIFENIETGSTFESNDLKQSKNRMKKTVEDFCNYYEPKYKSQEVSMMFFTFTRANYSTKDIRTMIECIKMRLRALKLPLRGYLWVLEAKENLKMDGGFHIHYHLIVATDRVLFKKIPKELKMNDVWGQRTGVEFIKYSVRAYLSAELYKSNAVVCNKRRYSRSKVFV